MQKRTTILMTLMTLMLMVGFFLSPSPTQAFTKVTATPDPAGDTQPDDGSVDIEDLLVEVLNLLETEDYQGAVDVLNTIIAEDETLWDAYFFRAFAFAQLGDFDRAIDDYTRAVTIRPYDWTTYTLRANLYLQTGDLAQANLDFDQAIYLNPRYTEAYAGKAVLNMQLSDQTLADIYQGIYEALQASFGGDDNENIDILTDTIDAVDARSTPAELGYAYYNRANTYIRTGDWDNALEDMNEAITLQPAMQDYYMARGFIYSETGEMALAAPDFYERMTLIELNPVDGTIDLGETVPVAMDYGTVARLTFEGQAGQQVTITARDSLGDGVDPLLVLLDADGTPVVGNDDGGGELDALINNFELPEAGTYTAVISHANGGFVGTINVSLK